MASIIVPLCARELKGLRVQFSVLDGPFGKLRIASTPLGYCSVEPAFDADQHQGLLEARFPGASIEKTHSPLHEDFVKQLNNPTASLRFHLLGTDFQRRVWKALLEIPFGSTSSYGVLATAIGHPHACRAVGTAVGANPIFIAIPCHRVLPATGKVGGFRWGGALKAQLLAWEKEKRSDYLDTKNTER
jgi:AraC family transcriptional regulator of adaptative response/methylated-DNA-[protein]-cysteine methyltransferase